MTFAALVIVLLLVGVILLAAEIFVIPGFGVVGILGGVAIVSATVVAWWKLGQVYGGLAIGAGVLASAFMFWLLPRTSAGKALVLEERQSGRAADQTLAALVGQVGTALTPLRPSGTMDVGGRPVDVVTDGIYVEAGARVRVARVEGARVVVEPE